ncbi:MAG: aminoacyl-tRNA hydrolase [Bacteroidota bacterium]
MYLIVGLGNMGEAYTDTRHNIGFRTVDCLASRHGEDFHIKHLGAYACVSYRAKKLYLLKPTTYMNGSGAAVKHWMRYLRVPLANLLVVVDDLHLPFGRLMLKPKGGNGGHNGLKSIAEHLQTACYNRLKFGIGNGFLPGRQSEFVLGAFTEVEKKMLDVYVERAADFAYDFCRFGLEKAMSMYNKRSVL